jgi:ATPase family protein associated with various cellular activities (AAA)
VSNGHASPDVPPTPRRAARGAIGGAANEAGAVHRAGIAAIVVVHGLIGQRVPWLPLDSVPLRVQLEGDAEIDDIVIDLECGARAFVQVKLTCDTGEVLRSTIDQWARAYKSGSFSQGDVAILAVAQPSNNLKELAKALSAHRMGTSLTSSQRTVISKLETNLSKHFDEPDDVAAVMDRAYIVVVDGRENTADADAGAAWLDGAVVEHGRSRQGFAALRGAIHIVASRRESTSIDAWRSWLREAGVPAHSDPCGVLAARQQAYDNAISRYRQNLAVEADVLPLHALLGPAEPMHLPGLADGISVRKNDYAEKNTQNRASGDTGRSQPLLKIARREGRLLLVGPPGAGKSVALQQIAAHYSGVPHAPTPIVVSLKQVAELLPRERVAALQFTELIELSTPGGSEALRAALKEKIANGNAILLLDALDETQQSKGRVVNHLRRLMATANQDLDLVMSSRHSAAAAALELGLAYCELEAPHNLEHTMDRLIEHLSSRLTDDERLQWLEIRRNYIRRSQYEEPAIWSVPLLATLAVLLLAQRGPDEMPATRAALLHEVVRDSVRRWAAHRADATLPSLDTATSAEVLIDTFADIAAVVASEGDWRSAKVAVVNRLQQHWGLSRGVAEVVAEAAVDHWDAAVGVFVTQSERGRLTARARLFVEIGDALQHTRAEVDIDAWIEQLSESLESRETIRLAAGLAPRASAALARKAINFGGTLLDTACDAWMDDAPFTFADCRALVAAQLSRLSRESKECPPHKQGFFDISGRPSPFAQLAVQLGQLPLVDAELAELERMSYDLPARQRAIICAIAAASRNSLDLSNPDTPTLDRIEDSLLDDGDIGESNDELPSLLAERPYGLPALVDVSLRVLLPFRPRAARRIALTAYRTNIGALMRVETELRQRNIELQPGWMPQFFGDGISSIDAERWKANLQQPFETIINYLDTPPVALSPGQAWHLDEAAAMFDVTRLSSQTPETLAAAARQFRPQMIAVLNAIIEGGNISASIVRAQLDQVRSEALDEPEWELLFRSSNRLSISGLVVRLPHLQAALDALKTGNVWLANIALSIFLDSDTLPDEIAQATIDNLQAMTAISRSNAAIAITIKRPDILFSLADAAVRAGHAAATINTYIKNGRIADAVKLLSDPDLKVRELAALQVRDADVDVSERLRNALDEPSEQWTCFFCDAVRSSDLDRCPEFHHSRPQPKLAE